MREFRCGFREPSAIIARDGKRETVSRQPTWKNHAETSRGACRPGARHRLGGSEQCSFRARHSGAHAEADPCGSPGTELSSKFPGKIVAQEAHLHCWTYYPGDRGCLRVSSH